MGTTVFLETYTSLFTWFEKVHVVDQFLILLRNPLGQFLGFFDVSRLDEFGDFQ